MTILIYNIITLAAVPFLIPIFLYRIISDPAYRIGISNRFGLLPSEIREGLSNKDRYWFHAVSVGEVMAAVPLVKAFKERYPDSTVILSTVTSTGNKTARDQLSEVDHIIYFPFDLFWIVRRVVKIIRPRLFIFFETEIWPNLLIYLRAKGIPSVMVNGRVSDRSFRRYRLVRPVLRRVLGSVGLFLMQTERDREKIIALGAEPDRTFNTGNTKYDRAVELIMKERGQGLARADLNIPEGFVVIVAGSTHQGEDEVLIDVFKRILSGHPDAVMIIAPRHLDRLNRIEALIANAGLPYLRRSELGSGQNTLSDRTRRGDPLRSPWAGTGTSCPYRMVNSGSVIILDTIGELSRLYRISTIAFVGGSLVPIGGHNILEPAAHGKPVIFGPYMGNFHEIATMIVRQGGAIQAQDPDDLYIKIQRLLSDRDSIERMGQEAKRFVKENSGAAEKNMRLIERFVG